MSRDTAEEVSEKQPSDDRPVWLPTIEDDHTPLPQQEDIITEETEEYPLRIIAGAGTGKTFTMIRTIEHLIDNEGISSNDILAVTFTNKAADSMQEKLHAKLGPDGYDVDAYTYHSICHRILSEYSYHAGLDPDFEIATDADKYLLILETLDDLNYRFVKPDVFDLDSWGSGIVQNLLGFVSAMKRSGIGPSDLDSYLSTPEQLIEMGTYPDKIRNAADEHLRGSSASSLPADLAEMATELHSLQEECIQLPGGEDPQLCGIHQTIVSMISAMEETCDSLAETFEQQADSIGSGQLEYAEKLPAYLFGSYASPPKGIPAIGFTFPAKLESYVETCKTARDLTDGYFAYEQQLAANELIDFDDAIINTVELLSHDTLGPEISEQWEYVFCDEFQDTDSLQFELIEALAPDGQLFVVGDDDQAIYGWRGADVNNIKGQLEDTYGDALTDKELSVNFRSRQPILDLANNALDSLDNRIIEKTLTRYDEPDYDGDSVVTIDAAHDEEAAGRQIRNAITHLLDGTAEDIDGSYDPSDIAILTKKHKHAAPILDALDESGIPYERAGGHSAESPGVKTVIAYLKALARPYEDEVSWNRVLLMRYRIHEKDQRKLNSADEPLVKALRSVDRSEFEQPDKIQEAREDIESLVSLRDRYSVSRLYRELKEQTDIEWYLSEQERRDLKELEGFINSFGNGNVQPTLDESFIEVLEKHDDIVTQGENNPADQPELSNDAINVMTIYKSKGLDFPVVIIPELTADEWDPGERNYDALNAALADSPDAVMQEDFAKRDEREARRVLHVGLTRAEDMLILSGSAGDSEENSAINLPQEFVTEALPATVPWTVGDVSFPIWREILTSAPPSTADWTDSYAMHPSGNFAPDITYNGTKLTVEEARNTVFDLAHEMLDGELSPEPDVSTVIDVNSLSGSASVEAAIKHSYTSLDTFDECERKHYLDHIVGAFDDLPTDARATDGPSQREIGILFHETAELAAKRDLEEKSEWYELCERFANKHGFETATVEAKQCIDRLFESEVIEWDVLSAEREFTLNLDGNTVTGVIDAIARRPDGELVVADYKATQYERSLEDNLQLPLYLIAVNEMLDETITTAGYVYVGDISPTVQLKSYTQDELNNVKQQLGNYIDEVEAATYADYTSGDHCRWCPHSSLPCSDEA